MKQTRLPIWTLSLVIFATTASTLQAADLYLETQVKLQTPKKDFKRSREGGLEHVPFRIWLPDGVKTIRGVLFNPL